MFATHAIIAACGGGDGGDADVRQSVPVQDAGRDTGADTPSSCVPSPEVCNGLDDDCDGRIDNDAAHAIAFFRDGDGDGFGAGEPLVACRLEGDLTAMGGDCDDNSRAIFPGAPELCDGVDNDCNELIDDGDTALQYRDADGDAVGDSACVSSLCAPLLGFVSIGGDCNDADETTGARGDCPPDEVRMAFPRFVDSDRDGFGAEGDLIYDCGDAAGSADNALDCDDRDRDVFPGAIDLCDGIDQDCDGADDCPEGLEVQALTDADLLLSGSAGWRLGSALHVSPPAEGVTQTVYAPFDAEVCASMLVEAPFMFGRANRVELCARQAAFLADTALFCDYGSCVRSPLSSDTLPFAPPAGLARPHVRLGPMLQLAGADVQLLIWEAEPFTNETSVLALYDPVGGAPLSAQTLDSRALRVAGLDANLDGANDALIADLEQGTIRVWLAPFDEATFESDPDIHINASGRAGSSILLFDAIGDSTPELVLGAPEFRLDEERVGAVHVFTLPLSTGALSESDAAFTLYGEQPGAQFGASVAGQSGVGLYVGVPQARVGAVAGGAVVRFGVPLLSTTPNLFLNSNSVGASAGAALATANDAGQPVLFIGAPGATRGAGAIYMRREPTTP